MKRFFVVFLILCLLCITACLFFACNEQPNSNTSKDKQAIIMIHGFAAGTLYEKQTDELLFMVDVAELSGIMDGSTKLQPVLDRYTKKLFDDLALDENGEHEDNARPGTLDDPQGVYTMANLFEPLYEELIDDYGDDYYIDIWQYDWRDSMWEIGERLENYINDKGFERVILISHSNGGQVVSSYLARNEANRKKCQLFVPIAAPFYGVTDTAYFMYQGNLANLPNLVNSIQVGNVNAGDFMNEPIVKTAFNLLKNKLIGYFGNMTSFYMLFPHEELFEASYYENTSVINAKGNWLSYQQMMEHYATYKPCVTSAGVLKPGLLNLEDYYAKLYLKNSEGKTVHVSELVNTYYICGVGSPTLVSFEVNNKGEITNTVNDNRGDSLVCQYSATLGRMTGDNILVVDNKNHLTIGTCEETVDAIEELIDELD